MKFFEAVSTCFSKYACFSGRARRSEYWYFTLFTGIISWVLGLVLADLPIISTLFSLAVLLPGLGACWRRLHDIGKSGGWYFLNFIPIVGSIILLVWMCKDSEPGSNAYGPNPKAPASADAE